MSAKNEAPDRLIAQNRRARFDYFIEDSIEAGLVLTGTEIKSMREGRCSINESYAVEKGGNIWLVGAHIPEYAHAGRHLQHDPKRARKLLLHRKQIQKLAGTTTREGYTLVPVRMYFNSRGLAKLQLGIGRGKKRHDKRETARTRDWDREKNRLLRDKG
ncbi:MAG: SsrA-binding protein SmpB [Pseudomonadota bacterium]|nr:SsrA-binding protein SmpB [Pseudomonadota bacterium]